MSTTTINVLTITFSIVAILITVSTVISTILHSRRMERDWVAHRERMNAIYGRKP